MEYCFVQSANAGISLTTPFCRIWVDFLHDQKIMTWSIVTPKLWQKLSVDSSTSHPDYIVNTHEHPDHFSNELNQFALKMWPKSRILQTNLKTNEYSIEFFKTTHESRQFADCPNNAIIYSDARVSICFAGDTKVNDQAFFDLLAQRVKFPDIIVLPFPWLTTPRGRRGILTNFKSARLIINHIPFECDDTSHFRDLVSNSFQVMKEQVNLTIMTEPLQKEVFLF